MTHYGLSVGRYVPSVLYSCQWQRCPECWNQSDLRAADQETYLSVKQLSNNSDYFILPVFFLTNAIVTMRYERLNMRIKMKGNDL